MPSSSRPRDGGCPWLRVGFDGIGAAIQEQFYERQMTPAASPSERRALQQVIADVETGAFGQDRRGKRHALFDRHVAARDDVVQRRQSKLLVVGRTAA